jgi:carotenoid cleavage dioxygenase-like enzyme
MTFTHHFLNGNFAPVRSERDFTELPILGTLPEALVGTLYRVGPNPQFDPRDDFYHWFAGDGMVHAFSFDSGKVAYKNRWMRTPKWQLENQAGKALFGTFGNPATSDPAVVGQSTGTANTNIVSHAGRLFALEESHQPFEFEPLTLESKGYRSFGGTISSRFTAHPKPDPETGELHFFAYSAGGPGTTEMHYGTLDKECRVAKLEAFHAPYASMVHDFVATTGHVLFPITPLTSSVERAMQGKPLFAWETDRVVHIGVLPKGGDISAMRWLDMDARHVFHFMNAWEADGKIAVYAMEAEMAPGMPYADGRPGEPGKSAARLSRWTIDPNSLPGKVERAVVDDVPAEFPRIDERYVGRYNRYGWYVCHADGKPRNDAENTLYGTLTCHDFTTGRKQRYSLPEGDVLSEPVFAPRHQTAGEGDGWIVMTAWRQAEQRSDLLVFNATDITTGPIAVVQLPCRVPFGFHGAWIAA